MKLFLFFCIAMAMATQVNAGILTPAIKTWEREASSLIKRGESFFDSYDWAVRRFGANKNVTLTVAKNEALDQLRDMGLTHLDFGVKNEIQISSADYAKVKGMERASQILKLLEDDDFRIYIDPNIAIQSDQIITRAVIDMNERTLRIVPTTKTFMLDKVFQNYVNFRLGLSSDSPLYKVITPRNGEEAKVIKIATSLAKRGYGPSTADEVIAIREEIRALEDDGFRMWSNREFSIWWSQLPLSRQIYNRRQLRWNAQLENISDKKFDGEKAKMWATQLPLIYLKKLILNPLFIKSSLGLGTLGIILYNKTTNTIVAVDEHGKPIAVQPSAGFVSEIKAKL